MAMGHRPETPSARTSEEATLFWEAWLQEPQTSSGWMPQPPLTADRDFAAEYTNSILNFLRRLTHSTPFSSKPDLRRLRKTDTNQTTGQEDPRD